MAYNIQLADRVREYLTESTNKNIEEKNMFGGLAFMINDKMCINVSGDNLMCRFNPKTIEEVASKMGYQPMVMKGREYKGYCYVSPEGFKTKQDFEYWINLCLDFNNEAKSSKKK
ncbi:TfoX/Sxy family protein [Confluentibacter sediminis]|uniref:TfoX/Sxy family protein n=1 Tax=Confluentibacter sediminis TaxID=2219045 RepID=UPI000DAEA074|nr:TfoX/Sxy family protein [Confluentibacter sediminis]